jgi:hypothetical protein
MIKKIGISALVIAAVVFALDTYTLSLVKDGVQGKVTFPTTTSLKYTHGGSIVPVGVPFVLDSFQLKAVDAASNVSAPAWIFVKVTPVNDHAPVIKSDTIICVEGGSITWSPIVTDADN